MLKHLNETVFQSGIHTLFSSEAMHDTYYKQVSMIIEKTKPVEFEGGEVLTLKWQISYVAKSKSKKSLSFAKVMQTKKTELAHCLNCDSSRILLAGRDGQMKTLYSLSEKQGQEIRLEEIWDGVVPDD